MSGSDLEWKSSKTLCILGLQQDDIEEGIVRQLLLCISSSRCRDPRTALAAHPSCYLHRSRHLLSLLRAPPHTALTLRLPLLMLLSLCHVKNLPRERISFVNLSSSNMECPTGHSRLKGHQWAIHWFFSSSFISRSHSHFPAPCHHHRQPL